MRLSRWSGEGGGAVLRVARAVRAMGGRTAMDSYLCSILIDHH